jgi:hypothetical protein
MYRLQYQKRLHIWLYINNVKYILITNYKEYTNNMK